MTPPAYFLEREVALLTWVGLFFVGFVLWMALGRPRARPLTEGARVQLEARLAVLAIEKRLRWIEGKPPHAEGAVEGVPYRIFPHSCGFSDGAIAFVATASMATFTMAVWPRDPPEEVLELGTEVPIEDALFDPRFAVLSDAPPEVTGQALGERARRLLLDLGAPALVVRKGTMWLLLPDIPADDQFAAATSLIATMVRSLAQWERAPYR